MTSPAIKEFVMNLELVPSSDFRFKKGNNHGLGNVYIYISNHGLRETHVKYPGGFYKFSDEGGMAKDGNLANLIKNDMSYI